MALDVSPMVARGRECEEEDLCAIRAGAVESLLSGTSLVTSPLERTPWRQPRPEAAGVTESRGRFCERALSVYTIDVFEEGSGTELPQDVSYNCPV